MPDLGDLVRAAVATSEGDEAVEAYAEESRQTEASALRGEVEGLEFAESRGVGVRVIRDGRLGYSYAADPTVEEVRTAVGRARDNAALAEPDEFNVLPPGSAVTALPELFDEGSADVSTEAKVQMALDLEARLTTTDPRVRKIDLAQVGDAVSRVAIASTAGVDAEYARTDAWCVAVALAVEGDETQTGFSFHIARALDDVGPDAIADEAVARAVGMLGAAKPSTAKVPVILDQFAAMSFLGVLASALNAESVLKGRSLFAEMVGQQIGSDLFTLVDDGTRVDGPGACPFDDEGVRQRAHRALHGGHVERVPARHLHGDPHGWRPGVHRQREARVVQGRAGRGHVELLSRRRDELLPGAAGSCRGRRPDPAT